MFTLCDKNTNGITKWPISKNHMIVWFHLQPILIIIIIRRWKLQIAYINCIQFQHQLHTLRIFILRNVNANVISQVRMPNLFSVNAFKRQISYCIFVNAQSICRICTLNARGDKKKQNKTKCGHERFYQLTHFFHGWISLQYFLFTNWMYSFCRNRLTDAVLIYFSNIVSVSTFKNTINSHVGIFNLNIFFVRAGLSKATATIAMTLRQIHFFNSNLQDVQLWMCKYCVHVQRHSPIHFSRCIEIIQAQTLNVFFFSFFL